MLSMCILNYGCMQEVGKYERSVKVAAPWATLASWMLSKLP